MSKPGPDREIEDDEIIEAIMAVDGPVASTAQISEIVGLSNVHLNKRLKGLEEGDIVRSKSIGNSNAWWIPKR